MMVDQLYMQRSEIKGICLSMDQLNLHRASILVETVVLFIYSWIGLAVLRQSVMYLSKNVSLRGITLLNKVGVEVAFTCICTRTHIIRCLSENRRLLGGIKLACTGVISSCSAGISRIYQHLTIY